MVFATPEEDIFPFLIVTVVLGACHFRAGLGDVQGRSQVEMTALHGQIRRIIILGRRVLGLVVDGAGCLCVQIAKGINILHQLGLADRICSLMWHFMQGRGPTNGIHCDCFIFIIPRGHLYLLDCVRSPWVLVLGHELMVGSVLESLVLRGEMADSLIRIFFVQVDLELTSRFSQVLIMR